MEQSLSPEFKHLKLKPICKPDVPLKQSRFTSFDENSLSIKYSFGYQCDFGPNICMLNKDILILISGNCLCLLDVTTQNKMFLPSVNGVGFSCVNAHSSECYFAAAEKGQELCINIFEYPSLEVCKTLKHDINLMKTHLLSFDPDGEILISISEDPENKIFIWLWEQEYLIYDTPVNELRIYNLHFSTADSSIFFTSGKGLIKLWSFSCVRDERDDIIELQLNQAFEFTSSNKEQIIYCTVSLPENNFVSGVEDGYLYFFHGNVDTEDVTNCKTIGMKNSLPCHNGRINSIINHQDLIITFGSDGFVKFWKYSDFFKVGESEEDSEESSSSEGSDSSSKSDTVSTESEKELIHKPLNYLSLNPVKSISLSEKSNLMHAVLVSKDATTYILIQDLCGKLWKLNVPDDLSEISPSLLIYGFGLNLSGMAMCPVYPLLAATSELGDIVIFECTKNDILLTDHFNSSCTQIIWPDKKLDDIGASLILGFEDGTIRWLTIVGSESKRLEAKAISKPHSDAIKSLSYNSTHSILVSQGLDSKLFFLYLTKNGFTPIGFYINRHEVDQLEWVVYNSSDSYSEPLHRLLIICKYSYMLEVDIPAKTPLNDADNVQETFYIENNNCQIYIIDSLIDYHELGDRVVVSDCEEMTEEGKEVLRNLKYDEKKARRESYWEECLGKSSERMIPPKILACLSSVNSGHIWLAFGKFDFRYLFEFALCQEFQQCPVELTPVRALEILTSEWSSVLSLQYSPCGEFIFMGLQNGSLNICHLEKAFEPSSGYHFGKFQLHDAELGQAEYLQISSDGSCIITGAGDGNIFLLKFNALQYKDTIFHGNLPYLSSTSYEDKVAEDEGMLPLEEALKTKMAVKNEKSKNENLKLLEQLKNEYNIVLEEYNKYLNKCESSLKGFDEIPEDLKLNTDIVPQKAVEVFEEDTKRLLQNVDSEFERESECLTLLHKKYYDFFKSRIESEKMCVEYESNKLESYRECVFPMSCSDIVDKSYLRIFDMLNEVGVKDAKEGIQESTKRNKTLMNLKMKLSATRKALIDYTEDTPILPVVLKYNKRKKECINDLEKLIREYEQFENMHPNISICNEAKEQLESTFFKFKQKCGLEIAYPDILCTFSEKKDKTQLFAKKMRDFQKQFNILVAEANTLSSSNKTVSHKHLSSTEYDQQQHNKLNCFDIHISNKKGQQSDVKKVYPKINWGSTVVDSRKSSVRKFSSVIKMSRQHSESLPSDLQEISTNDLWEQKKLQAFHYYLQLVKAKMDCEKKFFDIRFNMKCLELNALKSTVMDELRCTKIIEKFQMDVKSEEEELVTVKTNIELLKDFRSKEKAKWKQCYENMMKVVGRNNRHKGYFKQIFVKRALSAAKSTYRRHSSSESSESEQDIESEDDNRSFSPSEIDESILKKVMDFRQKKEEIEKRMKIYKRKCKILKTKQNAIARKIQKLHDSMTDTFIKVDSILSTRKKEAESFKWPVILYPENLHENYIDNQNYDVGEQKQIMDEEMARIRKVITTQVAVINKFVTSSVHHLFYLVISAEINDLIDVVLLLTPLIKTVSSETDEYFHNIMYPPTSVLVVVDSSKEEEFNFIKNVLEKVEFSSDTESIDNLIYEENVNGDSDLLKKTMTSSKNEHDLEKDSTKKEKEVDEFDLTEYMVADEDIVEKHPSTSQYDINTIKDSPKLDTNCTMDCLNCDAIVSTAITSIDYSELTQNNISLDLDYYMRPFTYDLQCYESGGSDEKACEFVDSDVEQRFPTYPGGGLVLTMPVLVSMQEEDADHFPYPEFYQKVELKEEEILKVEAVHIIPTRKSEVSVEYVLRPESDFVLVDVNIVRKMLESYYKMKESIKDLEQEFQSLKETLADSKHDLFYKHQDLNRAQRELDQEMLNKFSRNVDLENLLDEIEGPEYLIRKYDLEKGLDGLRKELNEAKIEEAAALKSFDNLRFEDTKVCFELLKLREEFRELNKHFAVKRKVLPKIGSINLEPEDPSKL
nr:cilia- and flagella-associated protein 44 [Parasteatoda tepidariorum]